MYSVSSGRTFLPEAAARVWHSYKAGSKQLLRIEERGFPEHFQKSSKAMNVVGGTTTSTRGARTLATNSRSQHLPTGQLMSDNHEGRNTATKATTMMVSVVTSSSNHHQSDAASSSLCFFQRKLTTTMTTTTVTRLEGVA